MSSKKTSILLMLLCLSLVIGIFNTQTQAAEPNVAVQNEFILSNSVTVRNLDPHCTYWSHDLNLALQVAEGLYCQDNTDPYMNIIPQLAVDCGEWSADNLNFTVKLRQGVKFHDGTDFNASAVVWNMNRIFKMDELGESDWTGVLLYQVGGESVINRTEEIDTYTVKFVLNYVFAPFRQLISFQGFSMLSPTSTSFDTRLDFVTADLVGTGPFIYDGYTSPPETLTFHRNPNYYNGQTGIDVMKWVRNANAGSRHTGLLAGDYDMITGGLPSNYPYYRAHPDDFEFKEGTTGNFVFSATMNQNNIPYLVRKALTFAFNYSYYLQEIQLGTQARMKSPIPTGITYGRSDLNYPDTDIPKARQILIDAGLAGALTMSSTDQDWIDKAESVDPIFSANISFLGDDTIWQQTVAAMQNDFKKVGVELTLNPSTSQELDDLTLKQENHHKVSIGILGWGPDYADPSNMINPLFYPGYSANYGQYDDPYLTTLMDEGLVETDPEARKAIYDEIQKYIVENLSSAIFLHQSVVRSLHWRTLENFYVNSNGNWPFAYCAWEGVNSTISPYNEFNCAGGAEEPFDTDTNTNTGPAAISGYDVFAVITALGLASAILLKKYRR